MVTIKSNKIRWAISAVLALLILFGTFHNVFSIIAFLLFGFILVFCDRETVLMQMFFVMPMANIFKLSPGTQSFFTILILVYTVIHLVLPRKATLLVVLFGVYVVVFELISGEFNLFRTIKLIGNVFFLSSVLNIKVELNHKNIFLSFISGNIVASFFRLLDSDFFRIVQYIGTTEVEGQVEEGENLTRFAGLYADPNYYAIGIIISMCLLVVLYYRHEINPIIASVAAVPMVWFLIMTYSKSALFMLLVPLFFLLYTLKAHKKYATLILCFLVAVVTVVLILSGKIEAFDVVMDRINASETVEGTDINKLTTGRFDIWVMYGDYLVNNIKVALFGEGIASMLVNGKAAHNTYIDIFYHLGICGGALLVSCLATISTQSISTRIRRNSLNYTVMICVLIMYFFLSELFYFDPPFHIFLAFMVLNLPFKNYISQQSSQMTGDVL